MATFFSGWKAADGSLHATEELAEAHERATLFQRWCNENICRGGEWSADMVSQAILDSWLVTPKRGNQPVEQAQ